MGYAGGTICIQAARRMSVLGSIADQLIKLKLNREPLQVKERRTSVSFVKSYSCRAGLLRALNSNPRDRIYSALLISSKSKVTKKVISGGSTSHVY